METSKRLKVGVLTSSRADFGIYLPLLKKMQLEENIDLEIIAFGTHLSKFHGYTLNEIIKNGFSVKHKIESLVSSDSSNGISTSYALTALKFAEFWIVNSFDLIFALGDRFEMAAAVASTIPFNLKIAHIHGGETTLGAIDNIYRDSISLASNFHFVATTQFKQRVDQLIGSTDKSICVGSLSLENLNQIELLNEEEFYARWKIDLKEPTLLITVHPETVDVDSNQSNADQLIEALKILSKDYQLVITMPNADTAGMLWREIFENLVSGNNSSVYLIENFGTQSYFTCIQYSKLILGNSSSGIIEAASFGKYVINLGKRQRGRLSSNNVINLPFKSDLIVQKVTEYSDRIFAGDNVYYKENTSQAIVDYIKKQLI